MDLVSQIIAFESGDLDAAGVLSLFGQLIKTGQAWTLQGSYGRAAAALIAIGYITAEGEITAKAEEYLAEVA